MGRARQASCSAPQFCGPKFIDTGAMAVPIAGVRMPKNRTAEIGAAVDPVSVRLFRPQNCGVVAHGLAGTSRVEDDQKLSWLYNGFCLQGDRSTTYAERAADCNSTSGFIAAPKVASAAGRSEVGKIVARDEPVERHPARHEKIDEQG
jgi:hypothetical protein